MRTDKQEGRQEDRHHEANRHAAQFFANASNSNSKNDGNTNNKTYPISKPLN